VLDECTRDQEERARAWLYSTYTRAARAEYVRNARFGDAQPPLRAASEEDGDAAVLNRGRRLLLCIPRTQRDVFWLYEVAQLPMLDVARSLGCSRQAAYSRLFRARTRLMALLGVAKDATHV